MTGETNLRKLLGSMQPELQPGAFVFVTMPLSEGLQNGVEPLMVFKEAGGWTYILSQAAASTVGLQGIFPCRMISLNVHSSLEAVGFLAAITTRLASAGMGVNPVSGFFHDHLFVPENRADEAMMMLRRLAAENA